MLRSAHLLQIDPAGRLLAGAAIARTLRDTLVVPRGACAFEAVSLTGVSLFERRSFARLQAQQRAPYVRSGVCATVRGRQLLLWFWDADEIESVVASDPRLARMRRPRLLAEPLYLDYPTTDGQHMLRTNGGEEHLTIRAGEWQVATWRADTAPLSRRLAHRGRPWAGNLLPQQLGDDVSVDAPRSLDGLATGIVGVAFVASASYAAYNWGRIQALEDRLEARSVSNVPTGEELGAIAQAKARAQSDEAWIAKVIDTSRRHAVTPVLSELRTWLESNNLVLRDLDLREGELRITLVGAGVDVDLPAALASLAALRSLTNVQLVQSTDSSSAVFSARVGDTESPGFTDSTPVVKGPAK